MRYLIMVISTALLSIAMLTACRSDPPANANAPIKPTAALLDPRNPLRDWNFVRVPYCNGSTHMGDNEADYDGDGQKEPHIVCRITTSA